MYFKDAAVIVKNTDEAISAINDGGKLVVLPWTRPGEQCGEHVHYLFVSKQYNQDNKDRMRQFSNSVNLKRISDGEKKQLLGKGVCAKVHGYEVDQVVLERLQPSSFKTSVDENVLDVCDYPVPVAPV